MDTRNFRIKSGLSQSQLADMLGVSRQKLSKVEMGITGLPPSAMELLQQFSSQLDNLSNALPLQVEVELSAAEQRSERDLAFMRMQKQSELDNASIELDAMRIQFNASRNALALISQAMETAQGLPIYLGKLTKMYEYHLRKFTLSNPKAQQLLEIRIVSLRAFLDATQV